MVDRSVVTLKSGRPACGGSNEPPRRLADPERTRQHNRVGWCKTCRVLVPVWFGGVNEAYCVPHPARPNTGTVACG